MGGGGDGGYSERQAQEDRERQRARDALNAMFGVAPTGGAPTQGDFISGIYTPPTAGEEGGTAGYGFDQAAYDAALADYNALAPKAAENKSALDSLYGKVRTDAFGAGKRSLDENKETAGRDLKFELFARGLDGGSVDIDQNALLGRVYTKGLTDLGAKADATTTGLRTNDEQTRLGLLQSIDNGMDQGSALSSALAQMKNNSDRAASEATGTNLGNLFADAGLLYEQGRRARGEQTAIDTWRNQQSRRPAPSSATRGVSTWAG